MAGLTQARTGTCAGSDACSTGTCRGRACRRPGGHASAVGTGSSGQQRLKSSRACHPAGVGTTGSSEV